MRHAILSSLIVLAPLGSATTSYAQETPSRLAVDVSGGHSAFAGGGIPIGHFTLGGGVRWSLTPKVSVGPEVVFMRGPDDDRDVFLTGKAIVHFMPSRPVSPARAKANTAAQRPATSGFEGAISRSRASSPRAAP